METSQFPLPSAEGWRELFDPARGRRRYRFDGRGRPREAVLADGRRLSFTHDASGRLRRVQGDDTFVDMAYRMEADGLHIHVTHPEGPTEVILGGRGRTLRRSGGALVIELDEKERPRRVRLPGSSEPLVFESRADGSVAIGAAGLPAVVIAPAGFGEIAVRLPDGSGWDERTGPGSLELSVRDGAGAVAGGVVVGSDLLGRTTSRRWLDGVEETFGRDDSSRLTRWTRDGCERTFEYGPTGDLVAERGPDGDAERDVDTGGRVCSLRRSDGTRVDYGYDEAGRRIRRTDARGETIYRYDPFGQLIALEGPGDRRVRFEFDGLGCRVAVHGDGGAHREHRDADGRLWAITDGDGRLLHTFLWWGDRLVGRIDGPLSGGLTEGYLCDAGGTLLGVVHPRPGGQVSLERAGMPPFGAVGIPARPTLYGHFADIESGLIHFGAREMDPELGLFLTPDPWHGGEDDPRLWSGGNASALALCAELPASGIHAYALCQFDPTGRVDRDGHSANWLGILRTLVLAPTWGMALTAISLFFFAPIDILLQIGSLIVSGIWRIGSKRARLFWEHHQIWKLIGGAASSRQGTLALGFNGLLPRAISGGGIDSDRAVTIGHVIWINREELNNLNRPRVIDLWNIGGAPDATGKPSRDGTKLNEDPAKESVVSITAKLGTTNKIHVHASGWTRGFGNAVSMDAAGVQRLEDHAAPGAAIAPGSIHLSHAFPEGFPYPDSPTSATTLEVRDHIFPSFPSPVTAAIGILEGPANFALDLPDHSGAEAGNFLELSAPNAAPALSPETVHLRVTDVFASRDRDTVALIHNLPSARFTPAVIATGLLVRRAMELGTPEKYTKWSVTAGINNGIELKSADATAAAEKWPTPIAKGDLILVIAATGAPAPAALPGSPPNPVEDRIFARIEKMKSTLKLAPTLSGGALAAGADVFLMRADAATFNGKIPGPTLTEVVFDGDHPTLAIGELLSITVVGAAAAAATSYGRVANVADDKLTLEVAPVTAAGAQVRMQRYVDNDATKDKAKLLSQNADELTVEVDRAVLFPVGAVVRFQIGGKDTVRKAEDIAKLALELSDDVRGTGQITISRGELDSDFRYKDVKLGTPRRFLRWDGTVAANPKPADFYKYPDTVLGVRPQGPWGLAQSVFFVQPDAATLPTFDDEYKRKWEPRVVDNVPYWVFSTDLPFDEVFQWRIDDHNFGINHTLPVTLELREYRTFGLPRKDNGANRIMAYAPEALVPIDPKLHDTARDALVEHELHHTVQNCYWGPLLNALPILGLMSTIDDFISAGGSERGDFFKALFGPVDELGGMGWAQIASIGGLMELLWKYVFTFGQAKWDYKDWQQLFSPISSLLIKLIPDVDPQAPADERWGLAIAKLLRNALDLRSWVPFTGFVPTLLPDSGRSFLEQQASRNSGDLYSTILTADDKFNFHTHTFFVPDSKDADLKRTVGDAPRLIAFVASREERMLLRTYCDAPGSPVRYTTPRGRNVTGIGFMTDFPATWIELGAGMTTALFLSDLYESSGPTTVVKIKGPPPARAEVSFIRVNAGAGVQIRPKLRAMMPIPPHVARAVGFYFLPVTPGTYEVKAYSSSLVVPGDTSAPDPKNDANTQNATLTVESEVKLDNDPVLWKDPDPTIAAAAAIERYITEAMTLKVKDPEDKEKDRKIDGWEVDIVPPAAGAAPLSKKDLEDRTGWTLQAANAVGAGTVEVRLFRIFKKNDDKIFNLNYADVPTIANVRSYLADDMWVPVRTFSIKVVDLPALPAANKDADVAFDLDLVLKLSGADALKITPQGKAPGNLAKERIEDRPPRGERWRLGPLKEPIEADVDYKVEVTFGKLPVTKTLDFVLTLKPPIQVTGVGDYEASAGSPLDLTIAGAAGPYTVSFEPSLPAGTVSAQPTASTIRITVNTAPAADTSVTVKVKSGEKQGIRRIKIRK